MTTATASLHSGLTLDDLSAMNVDELDALYRQGTLPASLNGLTMGTPVAPSFAASTRHRCPARLAPSVN